MLAANILWEFKHHQQESEIISGERQKKIISNKNSFHIHNEMTVSGLVLLSGSARWFAEIVKKQLITSLNKHLSKLHMKNRMTSGV